MYRENVFSVASFSHEGPQFIYVQAFFIGWTNINSLVGLSMVIALKAWCWIAGGGLTGFPCVGIVETVTMAGFGLGLNVNEVSG